jgi:Skp family chaperone for outer membrane proteins
MKKWLLAPVALVLFLLPQVALGKVGVVSFEDVLEKTRAGKKISGEIAGYFKAALQNDEKVLVEAFKQLESSKTILKDSVYRARKNALEERYRKLLTKGQALMQEVNNDNNELQKKRYTLLQPLRTTFLAAVSAIALQKGFDIVIEKSAVYYAKGMTDITDAVVTKVDSETK